MKDLLEWFDRAVSEPWAFIALSLGAMIFLSGRWLGKKLFDDDKGAVSKFTNFLREDSREMKQAIAETRKAQTEESGRILNSLHENKMASQATTIAVQALERQLVNAIQAKPDDGELFDVLFTRNPIPICYVGSDHRFIRLNHACEELWGYSSGELGAMTFGDLTADDYLASDVDNVERVASGAIQRYRMEKEYRRKNGTSVRCALYVFRYPDSGAFLHYISIIIPL